MTETDSFATQHAVFHINPVTPADNQYSPKELIFGQETKRVGLIIGNKIAFNLSFNFLN